MPPEQLEPSIPDTTSEPADLVAQLRGFSMRYSVIHLRCVNALAGLRDTRGTITNALAARQAVAERDREAAQEFCERLLPHADTLLSQARTALGKMPPAKHLPAWRVLLDDVDHATVRIRQLLDDQPLHSHEESLGVRDAALWPYATTWAERSGLLTDLLEQHRIEVTAPPALSETERQQWTQVAREARARGGLEPFESWYDATGTLITLAYLDREDAPVLAMAGDLDTPGMHVIGHFGDSNEYEAGRTAPPTVPPGVLRPEVSRYDERVHDPEITLQAFTQDVIEARHTGEVAEALYTATEAAGSMRGPLPRLGEFVAVCAEFSDALETRQGQQTAARLRMIATQINLLTKDLRTAGDELDAAVGVLPPHRTPHPRHLPPAPGPALITQRPAAGMPSTTPAAAGRLRR